MNIEHAIADFSCQKYLNFMSSIKIDLKLNHQHLAFCPNPFSCKEKSKLNETKGE